MGSAHINSQESVVEKEEKQGGEYVLHQPDRACDRDVPGGVQKHRKKARSYAVLQEVYEYYIAEEEKTVAQIASEECE